jgi:uncharacterized Zn finger protein
MPTSETNPAESPYARMLSHCPQCNAALAILRVIAGKAGSEYWTLRCTKCGGIHLDIVQTASPSASTISPLNS